MILIDLKGVILTLGLFYPEILRSAYNKGTRLQLKGERVV